MAKSKIEWTESTWNPVTGCSKVSTGCRNCYAERMAHRLQAMGQPNYSKGFEVVMHPEVVDRPLKMKKPQMIFVNSMSDLFHEEIPLDFIREVFDVMKKAYWHTFQVLTKRAERLRIFHESLVWPENVWMGVSVEQARFQHRITALTETRASVRFLSLEPLLGPISDLCLDGIDWVILGGESGPGARTMEPEWVVEIRDQCMRQGVPFFFKQWGGVNKKRNGRLLEGLTWDNLPLAVEKVR